MVRLFQCLLSVFHRDWPKFICSMIKVGTWIEIIRSYNSRFTTQCENKLLVFSYNVHFCYLIPLFLSSAHYPHFLKRLNIPVTDKWAISNLASGASDTEFKSRIYTLQPAIFILPYTYALNEKTRLN